MNLDDRTWWITICHKCGELLDGTEPTDACQHDGELGTIEVETVRRLASRTEESAS